MLGNSAYVDDVFEDDVSPFMIMEIHLFQETLEESLDLVGVGLMLFES